MWYTVGLSRMKKVALLLLVVILFVSFIVQKIVSAPSGSGAPPYMIEDLDPPSLDRYAWIKDWKRPDGPPRVGLQVGHWKNEDLPEELYRLEGRTGSSGGGKTEWEVNLEIAQGVKTLLEEKGIQVDLLPATVPEKYWADVFVAIHADGSTDPATSGFKIAAPRRDFSGKAAKLVNFLVEAYQKSTGLPQDPNITRNMRGYYAFAWWRYDHSVHPMAASVIIETGFLTNPVDRNTIVNQPDVVANGIVSGIISHLKSEKLL